MGDSTTVELTVLKSQSEKAQKIFLEKDGLENDSWIHEDHLITYQFHDVNYGELRCLTFLMQDGIAFDSAWGNGKEYGSGTEYVRFDIDGDYIRKTVYADEVNPNLTSLLDLINEPAQLKSFILIHKERVTPLPWDNQEHYGKIYQTKNLLLPTTQGLVASY